MMIDDTDDGAVARVARVAREMVDCYGAEAVAVSHERAELAEVNRDELSADAWRDIAAATARLLSG